MRIRTDQPILPERENITRKIAKFWDQISEGWQKIWGTHIHHGFYENNQTISPKEAQEKLIEKLANLLEIKPQDKILDVGCGMGGSSLYLANNYQAIVTGITLSPKQVAIATQQAEKNHIKNAAFKIEDALSLASFEDNSFDIIWSLESCEQFFDKKLFLKQAYRVLKPNGKLLLATWCAHQDEYEGFHAKQYKKLCLAFDVPYMPTIDHYRRLIALQNFTLKQSWDWSMFVKKSWDIGVSLANNYSWLQIFNMVGWRGLRFAKQIKLMQEAFNKNRVRYGVFLATKN